MIDAVQAVLLSVIVILTFLLIFLGIQFYYVMRDFRDTLQRANKVLDNAEVITENVAEPMSFINGLLVGSKPISTLGKILQILRKGDS